MLERVRDAVIGAGRTIEAVRRAGFAVHEKGGTGPVTQADREAYSLLRSLLVDIIPAGWLSEETADVSDRRSLDRLWIVDPLDGTKEFVKGIAEYTVAVALVENGEPVLGVVHNPATGDTFWAVKGSGAFRNEERIQVAEGRRLLASRSEVEEGEFEGFVLDWEIIPVGSIQYKLALIAAGEAGVTLSRGPKHEWDVCAGALIVAEAGGVVTDAFGGALRYNQRLPKVRGVIAAAPEAHRRALDRCRPSGRRRG